jgi:solute carrier family 25 (mitochondrial oxoglutarate transporter), member 11
MSYCAKLCLELAWRVVTHPVDLLKVRMQLAGELGRGKTVGIAGSIGGVFANEGLFGFYKGLSASLARQITYSTARFGVYNWIKESLSVKGQPLPLWKGMLAGTVGGAVGSFVGNPTDLVLIRMQADGRLPPENRRNYTSIFNGISRIASAEGVLGLWKGCGPTVARASVLTAVQIPFYDKSKHILQDSFNLENGIALHFYASMISGLFTTIASSPVDVIKTRIMNNRPEVSGIVYRNGIHAAIETIKSEKILGLYKGFWPNYVRLGPHTVVTFIALEQYRRLYMYLTKQ